MSGRTSFLVFWIDGVVPLFSVAAFVFLATVARALGISANFPLLGLHPPLLVTLSAGASCWMLAVPVCPSGHYYLIFLNYLSPSYNRRFIHTSN